MSLKDELVSYWRLDEDSGDAIDSHGANTLQAIDSPGTADGILGTARTFNGSTQSFSLNTPSLRVDNTSFTLSTWVRLNDLSASQMVAGIWSQADSGRRYRIVYVFSDQKFYWQVSSNGTSATGTLIANTFGAISAGQWYHVIAWRDLAQNEIGIAVNGVHDTVSGSSIRDGGGAFTLGRNADNTLPLGGRIDEVAMWKRVLSIRERKTLYNGGIAFGYEESPWGDTLQPRIISPHLIGDVG